MDSKSIVEVIEVSKKFPGVKALDALSLEIKKGEVHAILGENGAGKSTFLKILHGIHRRDSGILKVDGKEVDYRGASDALMDGIAIVHQEVSMIDELSIGQNIALGYEPLKGGVIDFQLLHSKVNVILKRLEFPYKSEESIRGLGTGERQMVSIAKALYHQAKVISLDEPTASLSLKEIKSLFNIIGELTNTGITIIYVSHRLEEIFEITDKVTILRDGQFITTLETANTNKEEVIRLMVGRDVSSFAVRTQLNQGTEETVLKVENLTLPGVFEDINFELKKGEILGFSGLVGAKRTDIMMTIFGVNPSYKGNIYYKNNYTRMNHSKKAVSLGIGLVPEDRKIQGFIQEFGNARNLSFPALKKFLKFKILNHYSIIKNYYFFAKKMQLRPVDPYYKTSSLSGGNQQKIVIAKWLALDCDILILDEPTKGVDVGAKDEIYKLMEDLLASGKSILLVSSELPEILGMSDRIVVIREGRQVKVMENKNIKEEDILKYAMGNFE